MLVAKKGDSASVTETETSPGARGEGGAGAGGSIDCRKKMPVEVTMEVMVIWSSFKRTACVQVSRTDTDANSIADTHTHTHTHTHSQYLKGRTRKEQR
jgi:hypothetical protein